MSSPKAYADCILVEVRCLGPILEARRGVPVMDFGGAI